MKLVRIGKLENLERLGIILLKFLNLLKFLTLHNLKITFKAVVTTLADMRDDGL